MHLSILGPTTPLWGSDAELRTDFYLLDHKTCPAGGAYDFGYLMKVYGIIYTLIYKHICCALGSVRSSYQRTFGTSTDLNS